MKTKALWQAKIAELLLGGMPFHIAGPLVGKEFGFAVSKNVLSRIWKEVCAPALILRRRAVKTSESIVREAAACPDSLTLLQLLAATASYRPRKGGAK